MTEQEQQRKIERRLAILRHCEEVTGNVAATCRYYGISRPQFYKWLHRYEAPVSSAYGGRAARFELGESLPGLFKPFICCVKFGKPRRRR